MRTTGIDSTVAGPGLRICARSHGPSAIRMHAAPADEFNRNHKFIWRKAENRQRACSRPNKFQTSSPPPPPSPRQTHTHTHAHTHTLIQKAVGNDSEETQTRERRKCVECGGPMHMSFEARVAPVASDHWCSRRQTRYCFVSGGPHCRECSSSNEGTLSRR
jgi:hypothetical protein